MVDLAAAVVVARPGDDEPEALGEGAQVASRGRVVVVLVDLEAGQSGVAETRDVALRQARPSVAWEGISFRNFYRGRFIGNSGTLCYKP